MQRAVELSLGGLALVLALVTVAMTEQNRALQEEVARRQQVIARAQALATINNQLIQLLASTAASSKDQALSDLLARNGVTFSVSATAPPPASTPAVATPEPATP